MWLLPVILPVLVVLATAACMHWRRHAIGSHKLPSSLPTPPGTLPLLGDACQALRHQPRSHDWLLDISRMYGGRTWAATIPFMRSYIFISDPACLEYVLKTRSSNFVKGDWFRSRLQQLLGSGIFAVDGHEWYWQRKMASNIFNVQRFKTYTSDAFAKKLQALCGLLEQAADAAAAAGAAAPAAAGAGNSTAAGAATPGRAATPSQGSAPAVVDLHQMMYRFTLDTFSHIGFAQDPGCLSSWDPIPFATSFDRAQMICQTRFWVPLCKLVEWVTGTRSQLVNDIRVVRSFAASIVEARQSSSAAAAATNHVQQQQQQPSAKGPAASAPAQAGAAGEGVGGSSGHGGGADLLSMFLAAETEDGQPLGKEQLVDMVLNFIIAGRDTTAQALSWAFHLLMQHPEVEEKLLAEAERVLGKPATPSPTPPSPCAANGAGAAAAAQASGVGGNSGAASPTSSSVASEDALLLVGGGSPKHAVKTTAAAGDTSGDAAGATGGRTAGWVQPSYDQLRKLTYAKAVFLEALRLYPSVPQDGKMALEADVLPDGTRVPAGCVVVYAPYAINRLPNFWGPDSEQFRPERWLERTTLPTAYQYPVFNAGPRLCLGQRLAELEGVYALVGLLQRFRFKMAPAAPPVTYIFSTSLPMKHGLHVVVERREAAVVER